MPFIFGIFCVLLVIPPFCFFGNPGDQSGTDGLLDLTVFLFAYLHSVMTVVFGSNTDFTVMACVETCIPLEKDFPACALIPA